MCRPYAECEVATAMPNGGLFPNALPCDFGLNLATEVASLRMIYEWDEAKNRSNAPRGDDTTRIVSMRKANRREQEIYQEGLGES